MIPRNELTLAINAGGRGRRLGGAAKGLLEVNGRPVLDALLELRTLAAEVLLIANDDAYARWHLRTVRDEVVDRGAPAGVVTALGASTTPWVLVVGCDMPFITRATVEPLLDAPEDVDVVCASRGGALEPLLAVYRRSLHAPWKAALAHEPSLRSLVAAARLRTVEVADPKALDSLNTPEDLARHRASTVRRD